MAHDPNRDTRLAADDPRLPDESFRARRWAAPVDSMADWGTWGFLREEAQPLQSSESQGFGGPPRRNA